MIGRVVALSIVAVTVSGCVTERSGADFVSMSQKIGPPKAGQARIVVFREKGYGGIGDPGWDVKLDGEPMSALKTGTYAYADRPAGSHQLSSTMTMATSGVETPIRLRSTAEMSSFTRTRRPWGFSLNFTT